MFKKTKRITIEGNDIVTRVLDTDEELDRRGFSSRKKAEAEFNLVFIQLDKNPEVRVEMQEQDVWTVYEQTPATEV
jgi:hypothetical protein